MSERLQSFFDSRTALKFVLASPNLPKLRSFIIVLFFGCCVYIKRQMLEGEVALMVKTYRDDGGYVEVLVFAR